MKPINSFDDSLLAKGIEYTIGTNDGMQFSNVIYLGTKLMTGKHMMVFSTKDNNQLTINPSYHTFTLENNDTEYNEVLDNQSQESIPNELVI